MYGAHTSLFENVERIEDPGSDEVICLLLYSAVLCYYAILLCCAIMLYYYAELLCYTIVLY